MFSFCEYVHRRSKLLSLCIISAFCLCSQIGSHYFMVICSECWAPHLKGGDISAVQKGTLSELCTSEAAFMPHWDGLLLIDTAVTQHKSSLLCFCWLLSSFVRHLQQMNLSNSQLFKQKNKLMGTADYQNGVHNFFGQYSKTWDFKWLLKLKFKNYFIWEYTKCTWETLEQGYSKYFLLKVMTVTVVDLLLCRLCTLLWTAQKDRTMRFVSRRGSRATRLSTTTTMARWWKNTMETVG